MKIETITEAETKATKIDHESTINRTIKKNYNFPTDKTQIKEAVRQNINDKEMRYNLQLKQLQIH